MRRAIAQAAAVMAATVTVVILLNAPSCSVNPRVDLDSRREPEPTQTYTPTTDPPDIRLLPTPRNTDTDWT